MTLNKMAFSPVTGLRDMTIYPADPATEAAAREQIQGRLDEIMDYLNDSLTVALDTALATITGITATVTELNYTKDVTSPIQTQLNNKPSRNLIINGNFGINQRVKAGTVTLAAGAYGHDRWKAGPGGCTYTFSTTANVTTITISAGSLIQVIEGLNLQSGTHTLSWTGTAQGKIGAGSLSASGVTGSATGGTNLNIEFGTGTLSKVQFEKGSIATVFEDKPYLTELALCQRYYEKSYNVTTAPGSTTGTGSFRYSQGYTRGSGSTYYGEFSTHFKTGKASTPVVKIYSPATGTINRIRDDSTGQDISYTVESIASDENSFIVSSLTLISSAVTANDGVSYAWTAEAEL